MPEPLLNRRRPNCKDWAHPIPPCRLAIPRMRRAVMSPLFGNCRYSHKCKERPSGTSPRNISLCWALGGTRFCWLSIHHLALRHPWHKGQRPRKCIVAELPRFVGKMGQHGRPPASECLSEARSIAMLIRRNSLGSVALSDPSAIRLKATIGREGVVRHRTAAWHLCQFQRPPFGTRQARRMALDGETGRKINHRQSCCFLPDITLSKR